MHIKLILVTYICIQKTNKAKDVKLTKIKKHTLHCVLHETEESKCVFYETVEVRFYGL